MIENYIKLNIIDFLNLTEKLVNVANFLAIISK